MSLKGKERNTLRCNHRDAGQRRSCGEEGRDWTNATRSHQKLEETKMDSLLKLLRGHGSIGILILDLFPAKLRKQFFVVLSH